jgi:hypothetical protein
MDEEEIKEVYAVHAIIEKHMRIMARECAEVSNEPGIFIMSLLRTSIDLTRDLFTNAPESKKELDIQREILIQSIAHELRGVKHDRTEH